MNYRLLGPLEVLADDGRKVPLTAGKERVLLAALLLNANIPVSVERLVDALWGESPPDSAANALQVYVSRLRKKLAGAGAGESIQSTARGYLIRTQPGESDLDRLNQLLSPTERETSRQASERLKEALALWRGPSLDDVESDGLSPHKVRLDELRIATLERRIEADLASGRHSELIPELESLVRSEPLREPLRGLLILALYRAGRQADALATYKAGREVLAEELGIDPSAELQALELAVLHQDPALAVQAKKVAVPVEVTMPSATMTFLFTDIEGSTAMLARLGTDDYAKVLAEHHRVVRDALAAHGGTEVVTQGDGFFAVFASPRGCAMAAISIQRTLAAHSWPPGEKVRVRMGLHHGEATETTSGPVGFDVHRAARVAGVAHGGQVLLSETAAALLQGSLPEGAALKDLGLHRLKDLTRSEHIFQLDAPGLESDFPALLSLENPKLPNNLPVQLTTFIGRTYEVAEVSGLVGQSRLVTITGVGGSGKTRLSLQVAAEMLDGSGDGVWFVDLAPLADPDRIAAALAEAVGIQTEPDRSVTEAIIDVLRERFILIVLDNCEHLVDACAKLTDLILRACPRLFVLATSREPLGIGGEKVYRVPPLQLPDQDTVDLDTEATRLFLDRARDASPGLVLDDESAGHVASICRQLDGIPLAIELAAARASTMDLRDIDSRLTKCYSLLTKGSRTALPRQQTLRALVDWSYDLLTDPERTVLNRLSVFAGSFDLDAAEAVAITEETEVFEIADILGSLVDKSLVLADSTEHEFRYRMLVTIRQFASEKLAESASDVLENARAAHARYFKRLAEEAALKLCGPDQAHWLDRLDHEHDNLRAAVNFLRENAGTPERALEVLVYLGRYFQGRQRHEGADLFATVLLAVGKSGTALRAEALGILGVLLEERDRRRHVDEGLAIARSLVDTALVADLLVKRALCLARERDWEGSVAACDEAVYLASKLGDTACVGRALERRAVALGATLGQTTSIQAHLEALEVLRSVGDIYWVAIAVGNLGTSCFEVGQLDEATEYKNQSLALYQELQDEDGINITLSGLGDVALARGDISGAKAFYLEVLRKGYRSGCRMDIAYSLGSLARCSSEGRGEAEKASVLFGATDRCYEGLGLPWGELGDDLSLARDALHESMGAAFEENFARGRDMSLDSAIALALGDAS